MSGDEIKLIAPAAPMRDEYMDFLADFERARGSETKPSSSTPAAKPQAVLETHQ